MKSIFLFFLLINVAYFYFQSDWFNDPAPTVIVQQPAMPPGAEKLSLLRERGLSSPSTVDAEMGREAQAPLLPVEPKPAQEKPPEMALKQEPVAPAAEEPAPRQPKSAETVCFTIGPFSQAAQASRAAEAISALGADVNRRQEAHRTPKGYWVYLPSSVSYRSAKRKVKEMQKKGLKDLFIMGKGSHKNAISLGLFRNKSAAEKRFQKVKAMGLKAVMEAQYHVTKQAWLDISLPGDQTTTVANVAEMVETFPKVSLTQRKCDPKASN